MASLRLFAGALASLLVLAGCGGGGGGGASNGGGAGAGGGGGGGSGAGGSGTGGGSPNYPLTVTVLQSPITGSVPQIDLPGSVSFTASVTGTTSATTFYVIVQDSAATFSGAPNISQVSETQYQAALTLPDTLTMGSYTGNLTISLCADAGCASVLGRTMAPYVVTIAENPVLTGGFSSASVALTAVLGDETANYPMRLQTPLSPYINHARFTDANNVLRVAGSSQTIVAAWGNTDFEITVSPDALPGTYSGNLEMSYCRGASCERMYRGVTRLPYTVTVYPQTNLKSLAPLAGATDWTVLQGSPARTGHVAATLDPANFSPRWLWRSPDPTNLVNLLEPVNSAGKVFTVAAPNAVYNITPILFALDEATGTVSWQQSIPDPGTGPWNGGLGPFTPPAIAANNVYVARTVGSYPEAEGTMLAFGVANGTPAFAPPVFADTPAEFGDYLYENVSATNWISPVHLTPNAGAMVLAGRRDNQIGETQMATDLATGAQSAPWAACIGSLTSPAFAGAAAVDADGDTFLATNEGLLLADSCDMIATPVTLADGFGPAVVPNTSTVIAVSQGNLVAFDTAARQILWSALKSDADVFVGSPAIANDTVFVQNNAYGRVRLEARRADTGAVLWTWSPPWSDERAFMGNVVSTSNLVFVSTRRGVYAIDRTTHQSVWTYPYGGKLSISANGVLYVRRGFLWFGSGIAAINLQ
jgi:outer membrane protein assembly factor BamB